jgi:(2Fe-2S) ferredoxin
MREHETERTRDELVMDTDAPATAPTCYVVVCRGPSCRERGGRALRARLVEALRGQPRARLIGYACFGQCELGPNVAFYPAGEWYGGLSDPADAEPLVRHAVDGGPPPGRRLELPEADRRDHLRNIAELVRTHERDAAPHPRRHWWWPF